MWAANLFNHIKENWAVFMKAKLAFIVLAGLGVAAGFAAGLFYYNGQVGSLHEQLSAKDGQLGRYRVALGIDPASKGALIELNNQELALRAQSTVSRLRDLSSDLEARLKPIKDLADSGKITKEQSAKDFVTVGQEVSQDFDRNLASDADNLRNELRKRLTPEAIAHIVRVPAFWAQNGSSIPITALIKNSGFDVFFIRGLADEIEQMAKLLPPDSEKKQSSLVPQSTTPDRLVQLPSRG